MKKNLLKIYESFFDDLDKLNQDKVNDEFGAVNRDIYDQHNYILSPDKNPEFFYDLCDFCKDYYPDLPSNRNGFALKDLNQITLINSDDNCCSYFKNVTSLDELQYFHNLEKIKIYSFKSCKELKSVIFPENLQIIHACDLQIIHACAFSKCSSLKKIIIPERFKNNMKYIFYGVDLTNVDITYI